MDSSQTHLDRELTFAEQLVGIDFNPSQNEDVAMLKVLGRQMIEKVEEIHSKRSGDLSEGTRMPSYGANLIHGNALREIVSATMATVKDVTYKF